MWRVEGGGGGRVEGGGGGGGRVEGGGGGWWRVGGVAGGGALISELIFVSDLQLSTNVMQANYGFS